MRAPVVVEALVVASVIVTALDIVLVLVTERVLASSVAPLTSSVLPMWTAPETPMPPLLMKLPLDVPELDIVLVTSRTPPMKVSAPAPMPPITTRAPVVVELLAPASPMVTAPDESVLPMLTAPETPMPPLLMKLPVVVLELDVVSVTLRTPPM